MLLVAAAACGKGKDEKKEGAGAEAPQAGQAADAAGAGASGSATGVVADRPPGPGATTPASAAPAPSAFVTGDEKLVEDTQVVALGGGKAHLAAVTSTGLGGVLRAVVGGSRVDLMTYENGDCAAGPVTELEARPDGTARFRYGQTHYSGCDEENEGDDKADIESHVDCVALTWDDARGAVAKGRTAQADSVGELPDWCKPL